jgi:hypothetical protein
MRKILDAMAEMRLSQYLHEVIDKSNCFSAYHNSPNDLTVVHESVDDSSDASALLSSDLSKASVLHVGHQNGLSKSTTMKESIECVVV